MRWRQAGSAALWASWAAVRRDLVLDANPTELVRNLLARDVLVVQTGCSAIASAKAGLLNPETALKSAGPGLREVCEAVGIPPVLHLGSCVDNSRLLSICATLISEAGICKEFSELPLAVAVPEAISEKIITTGLCAVASGIYTVFMPAPRIAGSQVVRQYLEAEVERDTGGKFCFAADIDGGDAGNPEPPGSQAQRTEAGADALREWGEVGCRRPAARLYQL